MGIWETSRAATASALRLVGGLPQSLKGSKPFASEYKLDTSKVDVKLARALYYNTEPRYKLGAGFARPAINVPVGFMGVPQFTAEAGGDAQRELERMAPTWSGDVLLAHIALLRDGEILLRPRQGNRSPAYAALFEDEDWVEFAYNPAGTFDLETLDTDIGAVTGIKVTHKVVVNVGDRTEEKSLYETVRPDVVKWEWENNFRPSEEFPNPLGFVPAIHMQNAPEVGQLHGPSELEPAEPYMRFYNDVMLHAGSASKLHSTAKLSIKVKNVKTFLENNFTDAELKDNKLRFKDKDILFFETGEPQMGLSGGSSAFTEGADVVQAKAPLGDTNTLLEYIFLNIVDVTEVPEWAYGGAIASSKASVTEQSAPLIHKVSRKRTMVENHWALAGRMALAMIGARSQVTVGWDDLQQRDTKSEAEALSLLADAVIALNDAEIVSKYAAVEQLRPFMPALLEYIVENGDAASETESERIEQESSTATQDRAALIETLFGGSLEDLNEQDRQAGIAANG